MKVEPFKESDTVDALEAVDSVRSLVQKTLLVLRLKYCPKA